MSTVRERVREPARPPETRDHVSRRYAIWRRQADEGHETCFATARRFICKETHCRYRAECVQLRAMWRR